MQDFIQGKEKLKNVYGRVFTSAVFCGVLENPVFRLFERYILTENTKPFAKERAYAAFVAEIYKEGGNWTEIVKNAVFQDENVYVKGIAQGAEIVPHIRSSVERELKVFSELAGLTPADFAADMGISEEDIATFDSFNADMGALYAERMQNIRVHGYGIFSSAGMFRLSDDLQIEAIASADKIGMGHFIGYESEREKVVKNTRAFVEGKPAANVLLCGDAGTGKSSTVKAVANDFFSQGVRLIELRKDQLRNLPLVMAKIVGNPLKFIIFIDDLSFNKNNDDFSMLKAALEGSASATADNAVIYATSNRRHIIKESFGDREGDDVHRNDTLQETLSLSERFGLTVLFSKPNKQLYLEIVHALAKRCGVTMEEAQLDIQAEAFALKKGSRSARCAEQFINSLL